MSISFCPHAYQQKAIEFAKTHDNSFLIMDLGLGKTVVTLTTISDWLDEFNVRGVLIFGTIRIIYNVWEQEAQRWDHTSHLRFVNLHKEGFDGIKKNADIYLLNYERITKLLDYLLASKGNAELFSRKINAVVYDESTKLKGFNSRRFKAIKKILPFFHKRIALTATPTPRDLMDLFSQAYILDGGASLGKFITHFRNNYFYQTGFKGYQWEPRDGAEEDIYKKIGPMVVRMQREDYLELPELVINPVYVTLSPKVMKDYKKLEKEYFLEIIENEEEVTAATEATLSNKLRQMVQGAIYLDDRTKKEWAELHDEKLVALKEIVDELEGENKLITYFFKHDLLRLKSLLKNPPHVEAIKPNRQEDTVIQDWNAGRIENLLVHPARVAHGLNLQSGGTHIVMFSLDWNLENHLQLIGRLHRQGQTKPVTVTLIVARKTVDEVVLARLQQKDQKQKSLLSYLKEYYNNERSLRS